MKPIRLRRRAAACKASSCPWRAMRSHRSSSELEDGGRAGGGIAAAAAISTARSRSREERRRRQSKVCGLGSIERGAGASLTACERGLLERRTQSGMGRRPKHDGTLRSNKPSRGHPELSLDPQCMQPLSHRHSLPNNAAPYRSRTLRRTGGHSC